MWLIGCLAWSAGDLCNGKKDATYILAQDERLTLATVQVCASGYLPAEKQPNNQTVVGNQQRAPPLISATALHASELSSTCLL